MSSTLSVFVRTPLGKTVKLTATNGGQESVGYFCHQLSRRLGLDSDVNIFLQHHGKPLRSDRVLSEYGVREYSTVHASILLPGGKDSDVIWENNNLSIRNKALTEKVNVNTVHISCRSDGFTGKDDLVGMVLWSYDGKTDWRLNGIHPRSGYIYVRKSSDIDHVVSSHGQVHGKLYKSLFDEEPSNKVHAAGFAFFKGQWKWASAVFNNSKSDWQDSDRLAHPLEQRMIERAYTKWAASGCQNYRVEELFSFW
eukprot:scpid91832/ scgid11335/ 